MMSNKREIVSAFSLKNISAESLIKRKEKNDLPGDLKKEVHSKLFFIFKKS